MKRINLVAFFDRGTFVVESFEINKFDRMLITTANACDLANCNTW